MVASYVGGTKETHNAYCRARYRRPDVHAKVMAYNRSPHRKTRQKLSVYLRLYGITPDDAAALLIAQGSCCKICGVKTPRGNRWGKWAVDHVKGTHHVRGI